MTGWQRSTRSGARSSQARLRDFTGNNYTNAIASGDAVAAIGWSGDAVQLQADNPDIEFVMPDEGCILWSDNMVIPVGAPNPTAAYEFMNYVYEPENQAQIADYNYYLTPVDGVQEDPREAGFGGGRVGPRVPDEDFTADCTRSRTRPRRMRRRSSRNSRT